MQKSQMEKGLHELKAGTASEMKQCFGSEADLLRALRRGTDLHDVVPAVLDTLRHDPLASAGYFRGDMLRALIELPSAFWRDKPVLFQRYQTVVRAGAIARRKLPSAERMAFWTK